jgi:hypothetical protein
VSQDPLKSAQALEILKHAVRPGSLRIDGAYTSPRSWGVYEIEPPSGNRTTRRYRIGNHPVRQRELEVEFGSARQIAVFVSRGLADELQRILNAS